MIEPEVAMDKLAGLGSAEAIAAFLREEGITGRLRMPEYCPVAQYIGRESGQVVSICPGGYATPLSNNQWLVDGKPKGMDSIPHPVTKFARNFDLQLYPELESD